MVNLFIVTSEILGRHGRVQSLACEAWTQISVLGTKVVTEINRGVTERLARSYN